jgi:hypothetical protein
VIPHKVLIKKTRQENPRKLMLNVEHSQESIIYFYVVVTIEIGSSYSGQQQWCNWIVTASAAAMVHPIDIHL